MKLNIFYLISLCSMPIVLVIGYKLPIAYFFRFVGVLTGILVCILIIDRYHMWWYGGIWISFVMAVYFSYMKAKEYVDSQIDFKEKLTASNDSLQTSQADIIGLNTQIRSKEKGIEQSIHMYSIIKGLAETINWKSMVPTIARALRRFLNAEEFALYLVDDKKAVRAYYRQGAWPLKIRPTRHFSQPVFADFSWAVSSTAEEKISENSIAIPFLNNDVLFCILMLTPKADISKSKDELLEEAASLYIQLLFGIERAKLYHDIEIRSLVDGLTQLYRRQYFDIKLEEEISRAKSFRTVFGIILLDVDHFKRVNDMYGHQAGDEVLSHIGALFKSHFYETDFCARYGGEEFVALCPRAEMDGLLHKMEGLRIKIEHDKITISGKEIGTTVSMGAAHFPEHGQTVRDIIASADRALYKAKNNGRNRIEEST